MFSWFHSIKTFLTLKTICAFIAGALLAAGVFFIIQTDADTLTIPLRATPQQKQQTEYVIFEKREVIAERPNGYNKQKISGYGVTAEGKKHLIYAFIDDPLSRVASKRYLIPTGHVMESNTIYLSGVGEKNFTVLSLFGDNLTEIYSFLENKYFPLANFVMMPTQTQVIYPEHTALTIYDTASKTKRTVLDGEFGLDTLQLKGLSGDGTAVFGTLKDKLLRINIEKERVYQFKSFDGAFKNEIALCPRQNYGVFVSRAINPETNRPIPPYGLKQLNLTNDTARLFYSNASEPLESLLLSCDGMKMIFKRNNTWHVIDMNAKKYRHKITQAENPLLFMDDGKHIVMERAGELLIKNYKSGTEITFGQTKEGVKYRLLGVMRH